MFIWHFSDHQTIIWPSPNPYLPLISSFQLKKSLVVVVVVGGGWWINQLQTLPQGLVFTFDFDFDFDPDPDPDPELDN